MIHEFCIASATRPHDFALFADAVKNAASSRGKLECVALVVVPGFGCNNYGVMLTGPEDEAVKFIESMTMALQPGKYSRVKNDPELRLGRFECTLPPKTE